MVSTSSKLALNASSALPSSAVSSEVVDFILCITAYAVFISRPKFASSGASASVLVSRFWGIIPVKSRDGSGSLSASVHLHHIECRQVYTSVV